MHSSARCVSLLRVVFREFRADDVPYSARLDYLQYVVSDLLAECEPHHRGGELSYRFSAGMIGALQVVDLDVTAGEVVRTEKHIRRSDPEIYKVMIVKRGNGVVEQDGRAARLGPGDVTVLDMSRTGRWSASDIEVVATSFPQALLPLPHDKVAGLTATRISGSSGVGALVSTVARQLPRQIGAASGSRLGTVLLDLVTTALADRLDGDRPVATDSVHRTLLFRIHAFIEERLGDPDLTPSAIAAAHHISPRYLYKLFATEQATVASWIRSRRLERCRRDLLDPALVVRPVSAIAARWGLTNPAHFNRLFRETYGLTPGEFRQSHGVAAAPPRWIS